MENHDRILHVRISASTKNFDFLEQTCRKKVLPVKNRKNGSHH